MAAINDLIKRIQDPELRAQIQAEVNKLSQQKKFGLVFEDHIPESTPLYGVPVRADSLAALKNGSVGDLLFVAEINDGMATCLRQSDQETVQHPVSDLVAVARFGEPIYPYLKPIDSVCNAPDSDLWHTLIEADNYHALQLLEYLYAGKVDCIYIDPPYNTGAKDWKYNNDYVDGNDSYRHSKWLSMMEKRLKIAKRLLNPKDSVLIVTIDDVEIHTLVLLLQEMFSEAHIQVITSVINPSGKVGSGFSVVHEYLVFVMIGEMHINNLDTDMLFPEESKKASNAFAWESLLRRGSSWTPSSRPNLFYPVLVDEKTMRIVGVGNPMPPQQKMPLDINGFFAAWPVKNDGSFSIWRVDGSKLMKLAEKGYAHVAEFDPKRNTYAFRYLMSGDIKRVETGEITVDRSGKNGEVVAVGSYARKKTPKTVWNVGNHNGGMYGSDFLSSIIGRSKFSFPKSLYAVHDTLNFFVANKPNALILDFFAGSGTTLHAVNLLNAEDGGHRRCIMVTNNEVSADEAKALTAKGFQPGDPEWDALGVARYVTWPRTVCAIEGHDVNGKPLKGNYLGGDPDNPRTMAEGFKANAAFFKLGFLDKASVRVGRQFREMLPTLWMKAGCHGVCPTLEGADVPEMMVLPENHMAILNDNTTFAAFAEQVEADERIETVYLVTDSDADYRSMARALHAPNIFQLYRDYLDNFRINSRR